MGWGVWSLLDTDWGWCWCVDVYALVWMVGYQSAGTHELPRAVTGMVLSPRDLLQEEWEARKLEGSYASSGWVESGWAWSSSNECGVFAGAL